MQQIIKNIDPRFFPAIGRFFSPIVLNQLSKNNFSPYLNEVCYNSGLLKNIDLNISLRDFFDEVFNLLLTYYRNEYVYKNIIANKILVGKHSVNTSQMLTEFRIGDNKADVVILNGTSSVYEIKSEFDTLLRLDKQIQSYSHAFEFVNVVTSPDKVDSVYKMLHESIGIISFTDKATLSTIRKPKSLSEFLNLEILFDSLRKEEYLTIIKKFYGSVPDLPNTKIRSAAKDMYCKIPRIKAHKLTIKVLKERNTSTYLKNIINNIPHSTLAYMLSIGDKKNQLARLIKIFNNELFNILEPS